MRVRALRLSGLPDAGQHPSKRPAPACGTGSNVMFLFCETRQTAWPRGRAAPTRRGPNTAWSMCHLNPALYAATSMVTSRWADGQAVERTEGVHRRQTSWARMTRPLSWDGRNGEAMSLPASCRPEPRLHSAARRAFREEGSTRPHGEASNFKCS